MDGITGVGTKALAGAVGTTGVGIDGIIGVGTTGAGMLALVGVALVEAGITGVGIKVLAGVVTIDIMEEMHPLAQVEEEVMLP